MAGRYDRKQTRYDPSPSRCVRLRLPHRHRRPRMLLPVCPLHRPHPPLLPRRPVLRQSLRTSGRGKVLAPYSGDELVYNATLGDWRTHNGVDAAAAAGDEVPAVKGGRVSVVEDDALWGGVVEIVDANGCTWRYCGVTPSCVVGGDAAAGGCDWGGRGHPCRGGFGFPCASGVFERWGLDEAGNLILNLSALPTLRQGLLSWDSPVRTTFL